MLKATSSRCTVTVFRGNGSEVLADSLFEQWRLWASEYKRRIVVVVHLRYLRGPFEV